MNPGGFIGEESVSGTRLTVQETSFRDDDDEGRARDEMGGNLLE